VQVNRSLRSEFLAKLAGWEWDVALLQEVPPRWLADFERATGAVGLRALTSRNSLGWLRGAIAEWNPDLIRSNEGGSNVILVRRPARPIAIEVVELATRPERRVSLLTRLALPGGRSLVVACLHLSVPATGQGTAETLAAAGIASAWADGGPFVVGGDLNLRPAQHQEAFDELRARFGLTAATGPRSLDHLLVAGLETVESPERLAPAEREVAGPGGLAIRLSDHAPVMGAFRLR